MAFSNINCIFSPEADYFAHVSSDGCLKIWETSSNVLKQEYTPSSHLSSTCSTLSWGPNQQSSIPQTRKKVKTDKVSIAIADLNLIAMGTLSGEVILYSVSNGDLHMKLTGGHTDVVNGTSWFAEEDSLFTCSTDQHIVRWSISKGKVLTKWKAGKTAVYSVCVVDSDNLLSAGSAIVWWDLKKETVLKKFTGHASNVFGLVPITVQGHCTKYFLSLATGDRVASVWQLTKDSDCNSIASFTLSDDPATLDISKNNAPSQPLVISVVTKSGVLNIFEHQLNGRIKKPLSPKFSVKIASMASKLEKSQLIAILATKLEENVNSCMVAYGNFLKPVFERMELEHFQEDTFLIRENHVSSTVALEGLSKIKQPERPSSAKNLAPGYMMPSKPTEKISRKKKRKGDSSFELPMEERLNAMYLGQAPDGGKDPRAAPTADSVVHLLVQGLQSKDNKLLNTVFKYSDEVLIQNTVKRLPLNSIPLLLTELHQRLSRKEPGNRPCLRWLKCLLSVHLSYLMSLPEIDEYIGPLSQLIEAREETFPRISHFVGFMGVLLSQIDSSSETTHISTEPITVYEDESSSEEIEEEDEMDHSENHSDDENHSESSNESGNELLLPSDDDMDD